MISSEVVFLMSLSDPYQSRLRHLRLGHMSLQGMSEVSRRGLLGEKKIIDLDFFKDCVYGKAKRVRFLSGIYTMKGPLYYVQSDLWGPTRVASKGGVVYVFTIIDGPTGRCRLSS